MEQPEMTFPLGYKWNKAMTGKGKKLYDVLGTASTCALSALNKNKVCA